MRLKITKSKNSNNYYVIKDVFINKKRTSKIVEKLGNDDFIRQTYHSDNPLQWATHYVEQLNEKNKSSKSEIIHRYSPSKLLTLNQQNSYNGGYLFLQSIYHQLQLDSICHSIQERSKFEFNLNEVLSRLLYSRILFPSSKLQTFKCSQSYLEPPGFQLHHVYRSLEVIAQHFNEIQSEVYQMSHHVIPRDNHVLYYDCTNFYFEIEKEEGLKKYGVSKEHRPNPLVQMGLLMDGNAIPLAVSINPGNQNEQISVDPLLHRVKTEFKLSKFIYCADAGLSSTHIRKMTSTSNHAYIVTQSIKKLVRHLKAWALDPNGWKLEGSSKMVHLDEILDSPENKNVYYKERPILENNLEQRLIVTYSLVYKSYLKSIREAQIQRALALTQAKYPKKSHRQNDPARFVQSIHTTQLGEVANEEHVSLNIEKIVNEELYDGFYAVCTNLFDDPISEILKINQGRWEIEASFRIMKSELKSRPVFLSREDRIKAHFMTCFLSLLIYRIMEKKLDHQYPGSHIVETLRTMNFTDIRGEGYIPQYTRTALTDLLHEKFDIRTDTEITSYRTMKKIIQFTKQKKKVRSL